MRNNIFVEANDVGKGVAVAEVEPETQTQECLVKGQCRGLFVIDPQRCFGEDGGSMYCSGGVGGSRAMDNLGNMIVRVAPKIDIFDLSADDHLRFHIGCNQWFVNDDGNNPNPFTFIALEDVERGIWKAAVPKHQEWTLYYLGKVEEAKKRHMVYPFHAGQHEYSGTFCQPVAEGISVWERMHKTNATIFRKGRNPRVEAYSPLLAEVYDPEDSTTGVNETILYDIRRCHEWAAAGLAMSHCLGLFLIHVLELQPDLIKRCTLITDATANVAGCDGMADDYLKRLTAAGMRTTTSTQWLAD